MDNLALTAVKNYPEWVKIRPIFEAAIKQAFEESTNYYQKHGKQKPIPFTCGVVDAKGNPYRADVDFVLNKTAIHILVYIDGFYFTALQDTPESIAALADDQVKEYCKRHATKWANIWANDNLS